jgi:NSS family neurotransmitter:Na+ symporter
VTLLRPKIRFRRAALAAVRGGRDAERRWSSRRMLILAACAATIGFNNFWQFPGLIEQHGGGAFLIVYVASAFVLGLPLLSAQLLLGQFGQGSPVTSLRRLAERAHADVNWVFVGWLGVLGGFLIVCYLNVIASWTLAYTMRAAFGTLAGQTADGLASIFATLVRDPEKQLFWYTAFVALVFAVVGRGLRQGLEQAVRLAVPAMLLALLALTVYAATTEGFLAALARIVVPDFHRLTGVGVLTAIAQAFFSLSLGVGVMLMFGAYTAPGVALGRVALWVVVADTVVGLIAAVIVFSVLASGGVELASGPTLLFQSLPLAFDHLPWGHGFSAVFFALLVLVAWISALAFLEPAAVWLTERFAISRARAALWLGIGTWGMGLVMMLSFHQWAFSFRLFDVVKKLGLFDVAQILSAQVLLPLSGLLIAVFSGWVMKPAVTREALGARSPCAFDAWLWLLRLGIPVLLVLVFLNLTELFG